MKGIFHMTKIISTLIFSLIGWKVSGYDFFALITLISFAIEIYESFNKTLKKIYKILKIKR